ncbi:TatD family hydrolase [Candidatus Falkowbacteria bacterium]|nr:TatD family hydrolase [Candidatus Falkowbacteria bacterium]
MLTDSHAHLNFRAFDNDRDEVIARCQKREMAVINVGTQLATSQKAIAIAQDFSAVGGNFFATVAIHPIYVGKYQCDPRESKEHELFEKMNLPEIFEEISKLANESGVVAIGETGFDYFRLARDIEKNKLLQKEYFLKHLDLAQKNNLPVILHCRGNQENPHDAYLDVLDIIKEKFKACPANAGGVIHCFGADLEIANKFIGFGFYIGLTGIITFAKKAEEIQEVARLLPLDKILIETDSPYLAPEPYRGKRNEPIYVEYVAQKIAELKHLSLEEVVAATAKNAEKLFKF